MTSILRKRKLEHRNREDTQREKVHVKIEAEIGVM